MPLQARHKRPIPHSGPQKHWSHKSLQTAVQRPLRCLDKRVLAQGGGGGLPPPPCARREGGGGGYPLPPCASTLMVRETTVRRGPPCLDEAVLAHGGGGGGLPSIKQHPTGAPRVPCTPCAAGFPPKQSHPNGLNTTLLMQPSGQTNGCGASEGSRICPSRTSVPKRRGPLRFLDNVPWP